MEKIPQDKYEQLIGEFKREVGMLLSTTFRMYGYDAYVPQVTDQIVGMAEILSMAIRGKNIPLKKHKKLVE